SRRPSQTLAETARDTLSVTGRTLMDPLNTPATARSESVLEDLLDSYEHAFGWARRRPAWQALPLLLGLILAPFAVVGAAVTGVVWLLGSLLDLATTGAGWL